MHYLNYMFAIAAVGIVSAKIEKQYLRNEDPKSAEIVKTFGNWVDYAIFGYMMYKAVPELLGQAMAIGW